MGLSQLIGLPEINFFEISYLKNIFPIHRENRNRCLSSNCKVKSRHPKIHSYEKGFVLLFSIPSFSQTIYIANSAVGAVSGTNVFTGANSINLALAAASNGDIIYVVPSSVTYNTVSLAKSVNIIGGGFNPDKPGALRSTVGSVQPGTGANNIRISGLVVSSGITFGSGVSLSNIMIDKCRTRNIDGGTATLGNVIVENCIVAENYTGGPAIQFSMASTNVRISNNIIYSHNLNTSVALNTINAALIENNIFIDWASGGSLAAFGSVTNSDIRNNIFYGVRPTGTGTYTGNTQQNNLSFGAADNTFSSTGNSSISNIQNSDPMFVNLPYNSVYLFTYSAALQTGSPAIGSGFAGINMGIFGGTHPFDNFGTSLPIVRAITPPGTVYQGTNMNVRVQAKGN
jgi:hypothetical protein